MHTDRGRPAEHVRCSNCIFLDYWGPEKGLGTCCVDPPTMVMTVPKPKDKEHKLEIETETREDFETGKSVQTITHRNIVAPVPTGLCRVMQSNDWCGKFWSRTKAELPEGMRVP